MQQNNSDRSSIVMYKMPYSKTIVTMKLASENVILLDDYTDIPKHKGFVFAPFTISKDCPIVVFSPEKEDETDINTIDLDSVDLPLLEDNTTDIESELAQYSDDFRLFHKQLSEKQIDKIVLARTEDVCYKNSIDDSLSLNKLAKHLFIQACRQYNSQFVALVSSPYTGLWLMATPETLLSVDGKEGHTMALAGTMNVGNQQEFDAETIFWSEKNRQEHQIVVDYISDVLRKTTAELSISKQQTIGAAGVYHLKTDFNFALDASSNVGRIISELHPTPAVCGFPKEKTLEIIKEKESLNRSYYSGFAGPLHGNDGLNLFVTLRCMQIMNDRYRLFAGGGLVLGSCLDDEFQETCAKMMTMKKLFEE